MRLLIVICLTFFHCLRSYAQGCSFQVSGLVEDHEGVPLVGATLWIESLQTGTTSLADGSFKFSSLCPGEYTLMVKFLGYDDQLVNLKVPVAKPMIIILRVSAKMLHDVVIEGDHIQQHGLVQSVSVLAEEELDALKGKSLGEMITHLPGVSALMTGPAIFKPVIHGLHSQRVLILNNGLRQEGQQWGIEHAPEIDPYIASEIEVVKGAESVRYGADAIGGVVIINTPPLHRTSALGGELNVGMMSNNRMGIFSGMLEGGLKKWAAWGWRIQGTVKKGGDFHAPQYNLSNTGTNEFDFSGTVGFKKAGQELEIYLSSFNTEIGILRGAHTGNLNDLQNSIQSEKPWYVEDFTFAIDNPRQKINHNLLKIKAGRSLGESTRLNFLYGIQLNQRKEFDIRRGGRSDKPAMELKLIGHQLDISLDHTGSTNPNWSGSIGFNVAIKDNSNVPGTGINPLVPDYDQYYGGIFLIEKIRRKKWLFEVGARYDHQYLKVLTFDSQNDLVKPVFNFDYLAASLGASYNFNAQTRFISNMALSSRPPHVSELYSEGLHHGTASLEEGLMRKNGELLTTPSTVKKEISKKWINTLQHSTEGITLEFSGYVNYINDYIYLRPSSTRLTIRGYFPVFQYEQTDALFAGADASASWTIRKNLSYKGKASFLYAKDITHGDRLTFIPPTQFESALTYKWPTLGKWKDIYLTVSLPITLRQYRAPKTVYPADVSSYTDNETFDFMPAPHTYALLNFEIGSKVPVGSKSLMVTLACDNLLNTSYRNYMNRLRYYADDIGQNFSLKIKYAFHAHD